LPENTEKTTISVVTETTGYLPDSPIAYLVY